MFTINGKLHTMIMIIIFGVILMMTSTAVVTGAKNQSAETINLPAPSLKGSITVEEAINNRRSERSFGDKPITLQQLSQLLWSAQGITNDAGYRAAPSAGALYPLDLFVVAGNVTGLDTGAYRYFPEGHKLTLTLTEDIRPELTKAALQQEWIEHAPVTIVFSAVYEKTTVKYGERGIRYVHMEVGYAGENLFLQAEAMGLGTVVVGAFNDNAVKKVLSLNKNENPLALMPVGYEK